MQCLSDGRGIAGILLHKRLFDYPLKIKIGFQLGLFDLGVFQISQTII